MTTFNEKGHLVTTGVQVKQPPRLRSLLFTYRDWFTRRGFVYILCLLFTSLLNKPTSFNNNLLMV